MKKYYPCKSSLNILRVIILLLVILVYILARVYLSRYPIIMWIAISIVWVACVFSTVISLPLNFSKTSYTVSSKEIAKYSGVLIQTRQLMRVSSVQYITEVTTLFSKHTGFNFLIANALGGNIVLLFLSKVDLIEIAATLSSEIINAESDDNSKL